MLNYQFILRTAMLAAVLIFAVACGSSSVDPSDILSSDTTIDTTRNEIDLDLPCSPPELSASTTAPRLDVNGVNGWINSDPLSIQELASQGKVILVDFWTYTCVNCLRTLPFLIDWHEKYSDKGLVILGVHTPEFEFEKVRENIEAAVRDEMVAWPVAIDNDYATWDTFGNRFWPAKYLIDSTGRIIYRHFGEGAYCETELAIRTALERGGADVSDIPIVELDNSPRDADAITQTRELFAGYKWSTPFNPYAGNVEYYSARDEVIEFTDPKEYVHNLYYLHGSWRNGAEFIVHARQTQNFEDYIALSFFARSVNAVVSSEGAEPFDVYVLIDGAPLSPSDAGDDIQFDDNGGSFFRVDSPRLYKVVEQDVFRQRMLKLTSNSDDFALFSFTFGTYEDGF